MVKNKLKIFTHRVKCTVMSWFVSSKILKKKMTLKWILKQDNHMISFFQVDASGLLQCSSGMYEYAFI